MASFLKIRLRLPVKISSPSSSRSMSPIVIGPVWRHDTAEFEGSSNQFP
jgi:hypothetical protein